MTLYHLNEGFFTQINHKWHCQSIFRKKKTKKQIEIKNYAPKANHRKVLVDCLVKDLHTARASFKGRARKRG